MFTHYRTQGFILKKYDRGEADQLLVIYTKDFGRVEILARAIRKISSKLRPGVELFCLSEIEFIQGRAYKTLTDVILIDKFNNIKKDLSKLSVAFEISDIFERLVKNEEPDEKIWQLLIETFEKLNNLPFFISHLSLLYYYFSWNLISILGYEPELYHCVFCEKELKQGKFYFNSKEGGIICQNCFKKVRLNQEISVEAIKILRIIIKKNWRIISRLKVEKEHLFSLGAVSDSLNNLIQSK